MGKQEDFISKIAPYVCAWRNTYGWGVASAIIAQGCLESAYGTSDKAQHNNFFGLKYKKNRVSCNSGIFSATSAEQRQDGTYYTITTNWYAFSDMNHGVQGYFQFIDSGNYSKAKQAKDPQQYLQALKDTGYATSINYVNNLMNVINKYNLTKYDERSEPMTPDSSLVTGAIWSPNYTAKRKYKIDTIIIHCMAGTYDAKTCGARIFSKYDPVNGSSSHYGISSNGEIWQYVKESARAWTTGGSKKCNGWTGSNYDHRSITIEVSNTTLDPDYQVSAAAMQSLINLCADICRRNGIPALLWQNNPKLVGDASKQNMALHRWFATKSCPGNFLVACMANIALAVNMQLATPQGWMLNGYDYSPVFDPVYYANKYADLKAAFGNDANALWNHFTTCGMNEFRRASAEFDPMYYYNNNPDVVRAFGNNRPMYYAHYVMFGKAEGRKGAA